MISPRWQAAELPYNSHPGTATGWLCQRISGALRASRGSLGALSDTQENGKEPSGLGCQLCNGIVKKSNRLRSARVSDMKLISIAKKVRLILCQHFNALPWAK